MTEEGLSKIVRTVALLLTAPITVLGLYIIAHGHLTPGGGFQGGTVIATAIALMLVAFGSKRVKKAVGKEVLSATESLGLIAFIAIAFLGMGSTFFSNFLANAGGLLGMSIPSGANPGTINSAGTIPLMNFAVGIEVASALSLVLLLIYFSGEKEGKKGGGKK